MYDEPKRPMRVTTKRNSGNRRVSAANHRIEILGDVLEVGLIGRGECDPVLRQTLADEQS
jgi:hypothetical protein